MNSNVWRPIAVALMTFILGVGATWVNDKDRVSKQTVLDMIHVESPATGADIKTIKEQIVLMQIAQARLEEKLDQLLKRGQ